MKRNSSLNSCTTDFDLLATLGSLELLKEQFLSTFTATNDGYEKKVSFERYLEIVVENSTVLRLQAGEALDVYDAREGQCAFIALDHPFYIYEKKTVEEIREERMEVKQCWVDAASRRLLEDASYVPKLHQQFYLLYRQAMYVWLTVEA